jgi:hypothetical protein
MQTNRYETADRQESSPVSAHWLAVLDLGVPGGTLRPIVAPAAGSRSPVADCAP